MARDPNGLALTDVMGTDSSVTVEDAATLSLDLDEVFPDEFGVDRFASLGFINWVLRTFSALLVDNARHGILEWSANQEPGYLHPSVVLGTDAEIYVSVQAGGEAQNPVTDTSNTYWRSLSDQLAAFATAAQANAGSSATLALTPLRLLQGLFVANPNDQWKALTNRFGLVERATPAEITARSGDGFVAADDLPNIAASPPNSSTTVRGLIRTATESEADAGTATGPAMTPALVQRRIPANPPTADGLYGLRRQGGTNAYERLPFRATISGSVTIGSGSGDYNIGSFTFPNADCLVAVFSTDQNVRGSSDRWTVTVVRPGDPGRSYNTGQEPGNANLNKALLPVTSDRTEVYRSETVQVTVRAPSITVETFTYKIVAFELP